MAADIAIEDRRSKLLGLISSKGFASLPELVESLSVSQSTIRRDLEILEQHRLVRRTHGGAVQVKDVGGTPAVGGGYNYSASVEKFAEQKCEIGKSAAGMISDGQAVILYGGTTCYQVAGELVGRRMNIITNSAAIGSLLSAGATAEVTLVGGFIYPRSGVAMGETAVAQLSSLHADIAVIGCAAIDECGVYNANQMMVQVQRKMMEIADRTILVADSSKLGSRSVVKLCDLENLSAIVTDVGATWDKRRWLNACGVQIVYAGREKS